MCEQSILNKNYEIITDGPKALDWETYELETMKEYKQLLSSQKINEAAD